MDPNTFDGVCFSRSDSDLGNNLYRPSKLQCFGKINRFLDETT